MNIIKKINANRVMQKIKESEYRITLLLIAVVTLLKVVDGCIDVPGDLLDYVIGFLISLSFGCFVMESIYIHNKNIPVFVVGFVLLSVVSVFMTMWTYSYDNDKWSDLDKYYDRIFAGYYLLTLSLGVVISCFAGRKNKLFQFSDYLIRLLGGFLRVNILYLVIYVGIMILESVVHYLFSIYWSSFNWIDTVFVGCYVSSLVVLCFPKKEEKNIIIEFLVKYILMGLLCCALAIVYVYMIKIVITLNMPKNAVFGIVAGIFFLGVPICIMNRFYTENNPFKRFNSIIVYMIAPLVVMQAISIVVRIVQYGITPKRYLGVAALIFELVILFVYFRKKGKIDGLIVGVPVIIFVGLLMPVVNMDYISYMSQKNIVEKAMIQLEKASNESSEEIDKTVVERMEGAYDYLQDTDYADSYIEKNREQILELLSKSTALTKQYSTTNYSEYLEKKYFDVSEYDYMCVINDEMYLEFYDDTDCEEGIEEVAFQIPDRDEIIRINLKDLLQQYRENSNEDHEFDQYFEVHNTYQVNDNTLLVMTSLRFKWDEEIDMPIRFYVRGYFLFKE